MKTTEQHIATSIAGFIGMSVMSTAAVVSMLELHHMQMPKLVPHAEVASAYSSDHNSNHRMEERVRREKEETRHALVSYGVMMRSHPTAGRA